MPHGYILVDVANIRDPDRYQRYRERVGPSFEAAGGEYLVRGGEPESLKGEWRPGRIVIARFPSLAAISSWWCSKEYQAIQKGRAEATDSRFLAFETKAREDSEPDSSGAFLLATSNAAKSGPSSFVTSLCAFARKCGATFVIDSDDVKVLEGAWQPAEIGLAGFADRASAARCMSNLRYDAYGAGSHRHGTSVILLSRFQEARE